MKQILYGVFIFLILVGATSNVYSCSCSKYSQRKEFNRAESVFIGQFVKTTENGVELTVTKSWKGVKVGRSIMLSYVDLVGCDYDLKFIPNKEYLIYAVRSKGLKRELFISVDCGGSKAVEDANADLKNMNKIARN
jgi:hypothetical protein